MYVNNTRRCLLALWYCLLSWYGLGAYFFPLTTADLICDIYSANINNQDDVIDLGGLTFSISIPDNYMNGNNGLPFIESDSLHSITIQNGTIERISSDEFRLFYVAAEASLILRTVTLENGFFSTGVFPNNCGGAIQNLGNLVIQYSTMSHNSTAYGAVICNLAGGIVNLIAYSSFEENSATTDGGVIFNGGDISLITANIFVNNTASSDGGAIYNAGGESEFESAGTITTISDCTFTLNQAVNDSGGAISNNISSNSNEMGGIIHTIANNTINSNSAGNFGGGIYNSYTIINFISNIVAQNSANNGGPDISYIGACLFNENYNLIGNNNGSCLPPSSGLDVEDGGLHGNSFVGDPDTIGIINPRLGPLKNNGGPTLTEALLPNSVAINTGENPLSLLYDQRGPDFFRTKGGRTDIGAFEVQICTDCHDKDRDDHERKPEPRIPPVPFFPLPPPIMPVTPLPVTPIGPLDITVEEAPNNIEASISQAGEDDARKNDKEKINSRSMEKKKTKHGSGCSLMAMSQPESNNLALMILLILMTFGKVLSRGRFFRGK